MGEETVLFNNIWTCSGDQALLVYSPDLLSTMQSASDNMRPDYHLRRWFVAGQVACRLDAPSGVRNRISRLRENVTTIRALIRSAAHRAETFYGLPRLDGRALGPVALEIGRLLACIGLHIPVRRTNLSAEIKGAGKHGSGHSS